ncbi:MAG TPA: lipopolysaccharide kinase InaA family protein [Planctomycetota bacterium]
MSPPPVPARERLRWSGPAQPLSALGLETSALLFAPARELSARLEFLEEAPECTRVAFPLPGTADARGNLTGRPGPLGTGWLWLTAFRGDWAALLGARFSAPRSASLAEREWNLLCHLRAQGIGTPEPLLVGARGAGLVASRSFLLVRAPEGAFPFPRWLRTDGVGAERARGLAALGRTLAALRRAGVELPDLALADLWVTPGGGACEEEPAGARRNRLPGVTLVDVRGARLRSAAPSPLARLEAELAPLLAPEERRSLSALLA